MARKIGFLVYDDFQILDLAGPVAAFEAAEQLRPGSYVCIVGGAAKGGITSSAGVTLLASGVRSLRGLHTLLIAGGRGTANAAKCPHVRRFVQRAHARSTRIASVCSGTYVLAAAGLLDGRRATTHWCRSGDFMRRFPKVLLEPDRIYVKDGNLWSSAGITAGIDLALALIAEDVGDQVARAVAQELVVYYRRPGGQSQFSPLLTENAGGPLDAVLAYMRENLTKDLSVEQLARVAGASPRHFSRRFRAEMQMSPAQAVARVRAEAARVLLDEGWSVKEVSHRCGFGDPERLRRTFHRLFGVSPRQRGTVWRGTYS